jgi:hypothetical protein
VIDAADVFKGIEDTLKVLGPYELVPDLIPFEREPTVPLRDKGYTIVPRGFNPVASGNCVQMNETMDLHVWFVAMGQSIPQEMLRHEIQPERDRIVDQLLKLDYVQSITGNHVGSPDGEWIRVDFNISTQYDRRRS